MRERDKMETDNESENGYEEITLRGIVENIRSKKDKNTFDSARDADETPSASTLLRRLSRTGPESGHGEADHHGRNDKADGIDCDASVPRRLES